MMIYLRKTPNNLCLHNLFPLEKSPFGWFVVIKLALTGVKVLPTHFLSDILHPNK